ncbi:MAG: TIR domain-containing protein [bacterium]|nr:TIR domain-containing protein [bacterium]
MAKKVFISHRNVGDDLKLAWALRDGLELARHSVFLDAADILPGDEWATRIKQELVAADLLVVLLSSHIAANPDMVAEEVAMAKEMQRDQGRPRIVPVRVDPDVMATLPYDLRARVNRLHHEFWSGPDDTERLVAALDRLLRKSVEPAAGPEVEAKPSRPSPAEPPAVSAPAPVNGSVPPPQPPKASDTQYWYVPRPEAEREAATHLSQHGSPVVLVGPEEIGKSYFLSHLLRTNRKPEEGEVLINLAQLGDAAVKSLDDLLHEFAYEVVDQLDLDDEALDRAWQRRRPPARKLTHFLERTVLPASGDRLFLAIDRADAIVRTEHAQDVFGVFRRWAELGSRGDPWERLRLLLVVSTEPSLLSQNVHRSPFNISEPIRLGDLDFDQVWEMVHRYGLEWSSEEITQLTDLVGGHPYLVRKVLYHAAVGRHSVAELLADPTAEQGLFADHLRSRMLRVQRDPGLAQAIRQVLEGTAEEIAFELAQRLLRAGLLKGHPGRYQLRYRLYEQYFREWL